MQSEFSIQIRYAAVPSSCSRRIERKQIRESLHSIDFVFTLTRRSLWKTFLPPKETILRSMLMLIAAFDGDFAMICGWKSSLKPNTTMESLWTSLMLNFFSEFQMLFERKNN